MTNSNQLVGAGSVFIPQIMTAGANPYNKKILVLENKKSISNNFMASDGKLDIFIKVDRFRLLGTWTTIVISFVSVEQQEM